MPELRDRFSMADEIEPRDLWTEAKRRADAPDGSSRSLWWAPTPRKRMTAGIVAFAVFVGASVFAWDLTHRDVVPTPPPGAEPSVDLAAELPVGWSELPKPPEVPSGAATVWTGSKLLVWGGYEFVGSGDEEPDSDGFEFDAAASTWEPMPGSPLDGRMETAFAWTGYELLIWGGWDGAFRGDPYRANGAAYNPSSGTWRMLPPAPISGRRPFSVWTGEELIVWGSADRDQRLRDGAAYDPLADAWRPIADGPVDITDGSAVWTGDEMIVFGAALDFNNRADTSTAVAAAYDPSADTWRELPPSDLSPQAMTAEWVNGELIAWDYDHGTAAYDPGTNAWSDLPRVPLSFAECRPESVATPQLIFGNYCGLTVVFSSEEDAWHREPIPGLGEEGCCRVLEPVAAGEVVLVPTHSYGMDLGTPDRRLFAYNPPGTISTDPMGEVREPEPFIPQSAERDGDLIRLPVVFPDGSRATLVYPIPLDLATLGVQPDVTYAFDGRYQGPIVFLHDRDASIRRFVEGTEPVALVNSYRRIEIWAARGDDVDRRFWMRLSLPSWTVLVPIEEQGPAEEVAASLDVVETAAGFPVIEASGRVELAEGFGEAGGAQLAFGDGMAEPDMVSQLDATIFLSPDGCTSTVDSGPSAGYGAICLGDGRVFASIYGDREFVASVIDGLRVEDLRPA